ncbi:MAG: transglutaminase-like domain-containing protein [Candidatus Bathyarchaeota archaeon]|nr:transglutaminase-like domain-containing protein [Candidatus Bathyarchaeota archaeon]
MYSAQHDRHSIRPNKTVLAGLLLLALGIASLLSQFNSNTPREEELGKGFTIVVAVTYENRNSEGNVWNFTDDDRELGLFMNNTWQTVYLVNASYPVERFETDMDGNPTGFMAFPKPGIGVGEVLSYEVGYRVVLKPRSIPEISENTSETLFNVPESLNRSHCGSVGPWQVNDPELRSLAYEIAGNEIRVLTIVKQFIVWIKTNIVYGTLDVPRYPNETLLGGVGDCDDQANLLITLCRVVGIPAYLQTGCIHIPSRHSENSYWESHWLNELTGIAWHGWAIVYVPPWGWLPVDLTYVAGDLRVQPLNAINGSAVVAFPTVQYFNVTRTDYVAASRDRRDYMIAGGYHILERDVMEEETAQERRLRKADDPLILMFVLFPASSLILPLTELKSLRIHRIYDCLQFILNPYKGNLFHYLHKSFAPLGVNV